MRFAYADPPYPGQATRHYGPGASEVNHRVLVGTLCADFPDGWALSTSSPALRDVLSLCPPETRVMAWVKPFASYKPNVNPAYAWEPLLVVGGRRRTREELTVRDWHSACITLRKGTHGAKPASFTRWMMDVLGWQEGDEMVDLFPGSGMVTAAVAQGQML